VYLCSMHLITGRPARSAAMPVLFYLSGPNFTFIGAEMWEYSLKNCQSLEFCPQILQICPRLFCTIFTKLLAFIFFVWSLLVDKQQSYTHFCSVGPFSHKFSMDHSGKTSDLIKKWYGPLLSPRQVWWSSWVVHRL